MKKNDNSNINERNNISTQEKNLIPESNKEESEDKLKDEYVKKQINLSKNLKKEGDEYLKSNKFPKAINKYTKAMVWEPMMFFTNNINEKFNLLIFFINKLNVLLLILFIVKFPLLKKMNNGDITICQARQEFFIIQF